MELREFHFSFIKIPAMSFKNAISWFEIPTINLERAQKFYEAIFQIQLIPMEMPNFRMRMFPIEDPRTGLAVRFPMQKVFISPQQQMAL